MNGIRTVRRAVNEDMSGINKLLRQVLMVHHEGRPDLFKPDVKKYTDSELADIIKDDMRPVFVAVDDDNRVMGYAFCVFQITDGDNVRTDMKTLYIDDLCVDEEFRGRHIGKALYEHVLDFARSEGCYNVTLNVWECNNDAKIFYDRMGLKPYRTGMEVIL